MLVKIPYIPGLSFKFTYYTPQVEILKTLFFLSETKSTSLHHQQSNHHSSESQKTERPYLGQTSLLPSTSSSSSTGIKAEPGYESGQSQAYSCQGYTPYHQQMFSFPTPGSSDVAYHHQHHVTAAAKLMASS